MPRAGPQAGLQGVSARLGGGALRVASGASRPGGPRLDRNGDSGRAGPGAARRPGLAAGAGPVPRPPGPRRLTQPQQLSRSRRAPDRRYCHRC